MPYGTVEVRSRDSKLVTSTTSDAEGRYAVGALPPGRYDVSAIAPGLERPLPPLRRSRAPDPFIDARGPWDAVPEKP